jgi:hypothetical protein
LNVNINNFNTDNNSDTFDFNQSQLYKHVNNTEYFFQELCERNSKLNLNPHTNINVQTNTITNKNNLTNNNPSYIYQRKIFK